MPNVSVFSVSNKLNHLLEIPQSASEFKLQGLLKEKKAMSLITQKLPNNEREKYIQEISKALNECIKSSTEHKEVYESCLRYVNNTSHPANLIIKMLSRDFEGISIDAKIKDLEKQIEKERQTAEGISQKETLTFACKTIETLKCDHTEKAYALAKEGLTKCMEAFSSADRKSILKQCLTEVNEIQYYTIQALKSRSGTVDFMNKFYAKNEELFPGTCILPFCQGLAYSKGSLGGVCSGVAKTFLNDIKEKQKIFGHPIKEIDNPIFAPIDKKISASSDVYLNQTLTISDRMFVSQIENRRFIVAQYGDKNFSQSKTGGLVNDLKQINSEENKSSFYLSLQSKDKKIGHALGAFLNDDGRVFFCDANCGVFVIKGLNEFEKWFDFYFDAMEYPKYYELYTIRSYAESYSKTKQTDFIEEEVASPVLKDVSSVYMQTRNCLFNGLNQLHKEWAYSLEGKGDYGATLLKRLESGQNTIDNLNLAVARLEGASVSKELKRIENSDLETVLKWAEDIMVDIKKDKVVRIGQRVLNKTEIQQFKKAVKSLAEQARDLMNNGIEEVLSKYEELPESEVDLFEDCQRILWETTGSLGAEN
jgi:hypothetical protein